MLVSLGTTALAWARRSGDTASKKEVADLSQRLNDAMNSTMSNTGEGLQALRTKVNEVEIWSRDNLVRRDDFDRLMDEVQEQKIGQRLALIEDKVNTMWAFQMRRAMSEVVESGAGTKNSPLIFTEQAREAFGPFKKQLVEFYKTLPATMDDSEVLLEIERKFGDVLLDNVCIPFKLSHGACLLLAYAVARQTDTINIRL